MTGAFAPAYSGAFDVLVGDDGGGEEPVVVVQCKLRNFTGKAFTEYNACKKAQKENAAAAAAAGG